MTLAAGDGQELTLVFEGDDASEASMAIQALFLNKFGKGISRYKTFVLFHLFFLLSSFGYSQDRRIVRRVFLGRVTPRKARKRTKWKN